MSVYAISDLHGCLDLLKQVQNFLKDDDIVYCLGDCCDRGPEPWKTVKEVFQDKRFIYLKGNHEDMLDKAMFDFLIAERFGFDYETLCFNGGEQTFQEWRSNEFRNEWRRKIHNLPLIDTYINKQGLTIYLCHAGFTPSENLAGNDLLWNREHFFDKIPESGNNAVVVHGHTPIPFMLETFNQAGVNTDYNDGAFWYAKNHKVNIDCGSCFTGKTVLLDLDTFDEHIFS